VLSVSARLLACVRYSRTGPDAANPHLSIFDVSKAFVEAAHAPPHLPSEVDGRGLYDVLAEIDRQWERGEHGLCWCSQGEFFTRVAIKKDAAGVYQTSIGPLRAAKKVCQMLWFPNVVGIQQSQPFAGRKGDSRIAGGCQATVLFVSSVTHPLSHG
jgi:hypothetical protein